MRQKYATGGDLEYNWVNGKWEPKWKGVPYPSSTKNDAHTLPPVTVTNGKRVKPLASNGVESTTQALAYPNAPTYIDPNVKPLTTNLNSENGSTSNKPKTINRNSVFSKAGDIIPYVSNIANSLRKVPLPDAPGVISPVGARQINYDAQRAEADRQMRSMNKSADVSLDENTAAGVKGSNLAGTIRAKNSISEAENNANAQIGMQTNQINAGIDAQNVGLQNQWHRDLTEAQVAQQREQSANLSNAADKYIAQRNVKGAADLDRERWQVYQPVWKNSGVSGRAFGNDSDYAKWLQTNNPDKYAQEYPTKQKFGGSIVKTTTKFAGGGYMRVKVYN
jgi:hypothetical protein